MDLTAFSPSVGARNSDVTGRVALVWRGDPAAPPPVPGETRLRLIFQALEACGLRAEPVIWDDDAVDTIRQRLSAFDGVLVWVDPLSDDRDRSRLDPMLCELASSGVWVSAHPDVILKMGVKEVLYRTRQLGWGADTHLYETRDSLRSRFPEVLAAAGPRVLKQNRGNGGQGVWKVELADRVGPEASVKVLHAVRGSAPDTLALDDFIERCSVYFVGGGKLIDQPFQARLPDGMIRCYLSRARVVGYGQQRIKALIEPPAEGQTAEAAQPGPRVMHAPDAAPFQPLRNRMEREWVPQMQALLGISTTSLPALWDADFLYGPKTADGADTYVLCEINVSSVAPFPESAAEAVAEVALESARAARRGQR